MMVMVSCKVCSSVSLTGWHWVGPRMGRPPFLVDTKEACCNAWAYKYVVILPICDLLSLSLAPNIGRGEATYMDGLGLVANPYIIGNPVHGDMFVGREDVLRRLEELWGQEGPRSSVVLYGHRRMGKTSVLQNLSGRFGSQTLVVDFSMQRLGRIRQDGELLFNLALRLYDVWHASGYDNVVEPIEQDFMGNYAYTAFDRFLAKLGQVRGNHRFI